MDWAHLDHLFVLLNSLPSRGSKFEHILVKIYQVFSRFSLTALVDMAARQGVFSLSNG